MKKRILSLVLCAAMLLSMCLFLGAGVMDDTTADGSAETTESYIPAVNFTNVAPFGPAVTGVSPLRARSVTPLGLDDSTTGSDNGLVTSKTAKANPDGSTYTITLEAFATGEVKVSSESKPCDIVLVLDRSTSMENLFSSASTSYEPVYESKLDKRETYYVKNGRGNYVEVKWCSTCGAWTNNCRDKWFRHSAGTAYTPKASGDDQNTQFYVRHTQEAMSRMQALHSAANNFITSVNSQSPDSRIAVVSFGENGYIHTGNSNTALLDVSDNTQTIRDAINGVSADEYATEHGRGLVEANNIFSSYGSTGRNRVVVMITDGEPAPYNTSYWSSRTVKQAIENAYTLKNTYAASVYCISVMPGTDASNPTTDMDKYMSYVSSNYPNARYPGKSIDNQNEKGDSYYTGSKSDIIKQITPGDKVDTSKGSYYLTAGDIGALNSIFDKISTQTGGSSVTLDSKTVVKDVVTPYFTVPDAADVSVKSYDCLSYDAATKKATWAEKGTDIQEAVNITGSTIDVSNFDFSHNFVAETGRLEGDTTKPGNFHGRKLVISFTVTPKAGFLGGNNVPTNGEDSGVYSGDKLVENFVVPTVNVPIPSFTVGAAEKNVYLLGNLTQEQLLEGSTITVGTTDITPYLNDKQNEYWQDDYVTITRATEQSSYSSLTDDTTYTVTVKVSPNETKTETSSGAPATAKTSSGTAAVNVYKPVLTYKDSEVYYGEAVPSSFEDNLTSTEWKHGETEAPASMGPAPTLTMIYTPEAAKIDGGKINTRQDVGVDVAVKIGQTPVTNYVSFVHNDCVAGTPCTVPAGCEFVLHVKTCSLTIKKTVAGGGDSDQTFVFNVKDKDDKVVTTIVLKDGKQKTITGLAVGDYTVVEDTGWSWSYTAVSGNNTKVTLSSARDSNTVEVTNKYNKPNWLTSIADVINKWLSADDVQQFPGKN